MRFITVFSKARHCTPSRGSPHLPKDTSNIILPCAPRSSTWYFPLTFPDHNFACIYHSPILATCLVHLSLLRLVTLAILGEQLAYKWTRFFPFTCVSLNLSFAFDTLPLCTALRMFHFFAYLIFHFGFPMPAIFESCISVAYFIILFLTQSYLT